VKYTETIIIHILLYPLYVVAVNEDQVASFRVGANTISYFFTYVLYLTFAISIER